jgi:hypothetical protein
MSNVIYGNMVGGGVAPLKTLILTDENGNEVVGVVTESIQIFDATPADVIIGKTFVSNEGIQVGENTKTYRTEQGYVLIPVGKNFIISLYDYDMYDYTKLQCIIAPYNTTIENSVATDKVVINDCVYPVGSTVKLSDISKDSKTQSVNLNITNNSESRYVIHYFTYREEV